MANRDWNSMDWAEHAVDFGYNMSTYAARFDRHSHLYTGYPEMRPAADYDAGDRCMCPHCASEGWYAASPLCRFWRFDCDECGGTRFVRVRTEAGWVREACSVCPAVWRGDVRFFREALRYPVRVARELRSEAAARRVVDHEPTDAELVAALGKGVEAGEFIVFNPAA
jgi:hypothetical protein